MMMNDSDKVKLILNIGDQRLSINVPFERQDFARDVEQSIDMLYRQWRKSFPQKTDHEILAMVTYQFASHYSEIRRAYDTAREKVAECLEQTDDIPA